MVGGVSEDHNQPHPRPSSKKAHPEISSHDTCLPAFAILFQSAVANFM